MPRQLYLIKIPIFKLSKSIQTIGLKFQCSLIPLSGCRFNKQTNEFSDLRARGQSQRRGWPPPHRPKLLVTTGDLEYRITACLVISRRKGQPRAAWEIGASASGHTLAPGSPGEGGGESPLEDGLGGAGEMHWVRGWARQSLLWQLVQGVQELAEVGPVQRLERPAQHQDFLQQPQYGYKNVPTHKMQIVTFTSREACRLANDCLMPLPTCQIMASGGCSLKGHSPHSSSYHTVLSITNHTLSVKLA